MEARSHLRQLHIVSRPQLEERRVRGEAIRRRVARLQVSALNLLEGYAKEMHMRYRGDAREMEASSHLEGNHRASNHLLAEARSRLNLVPATWQGRESEELWGSRAVERRCGTGTVQMAVERAAVEAYKVIVAPTTPDSGSMSPLGSPSSQWSGTQLVRFLAQGCPVCGLTAALCHSKSSQMRTCMPRATTSFERESSRSHHSRAINES